MASVKREAGQSIGGYTVIDTLGRGGSGAVYKVRDGAGVEAALKLVDATADGIAAKRLEREVRALQSLRHPSVPRVIDAELDQDLTFVVFELVPGQSLFYYVQEHGPLEGDELADFAEQVASALEAVHAAGVVHRDVTPSNIMMGPDGPVLIDFGLSHRHEDERLTRDGLVSGTTGYVAPEVINGAKPGPIADRWAWAATVAFAMAGEGPFGSGSAAIGRTLESNPELPDVVGAHALAAALDRDISIRPGMRDVVAALRGATEVFAARDLDTEYDDEEYEDGEWVDEDAEWAEDQVPLWERGGASWRPRRPGTIAAWCIALAVCAAVAPLASIGVIVVLTVLSRTAHRRAAAIDALAERRGARRSDSVVQTIGLPWHMARAVAEILPATLVSLLVGSGVVALGWWLVSEDLLALARPIEQAWASSGALALGALVAVLVLWRGPWMSGTRIGAHRLAGTLAPTSGVATFWIVVAFVGVVAVVFAVYLGIEPWWWPLTAEQAGTSGLYVRA